MIDWILANKNWLFSGLGISIITLIYVIFIRFLKKIPKISNEKFKKKKIFEFKTSFRIRFAEENDLKNISDLANKYLGNGHGISESRATNWFQKNKKIFRIIECCSDFFEDANNIKWHFCGYYSVVPLCKTTYSLLKNNDIQDYKINSDSILPFDSEELNHLYVMDLMTINNSDCCNSFCGTALIKDMVSYIRYLLKKNNNISEISTITATKEGRELAARFGLNINSNYGNELGWDFWSIKKLDLNLEEKLNKYKILNLNNKFKEFYLI